MLTHVATVPPVYFVDDATGIEVFNRGDEQDEQELYIRAVRSGGG